MRKLGFALGLSVAALVAACGGGGGSSGDTQERYSITLRADKTALPINISHYPVGQGVEAPFTTTLYVNGREGNDPIQGGEDIFQCNVAGGLSTGSLYYLDGDEDHEDDDGNPLAYRSITLGANAGGNSFHFHAGDQAGTATITCSVTDPRDNRVYSASVNLTVGGGSGSGKAASIQAIARYPALGVQGNPYNMRTSTAINAYVWDDANQPVQSSGRPNLQVSIASTGGAAAAARLLAGSQQGSVIQIVGTGGVGLFSLSSGRQEGPILLEMTTDRFDNDVSNGIQDPITGLLLVSASNQDPNAALVDPLEFVDIAPPNATNGLPYSYALSATGGTPPYTWAALGGLPDGMSFSSSGLLSGTPVLKQPGDVQVAVRVTDSRGVSLTGNFTLTVDETGANDPETLPLSINLSGCGSSVNTVCELPGAPVGGDYRYVLTATGAGSGPVLWSFEPATGAVLHPSWLNITKTGILYSTPVNPASPPTPPATGNVPVACGVFGNTFFIRATKGDATAMRQVQIRGVGGPGGTC